MGEPAEDIYVPEAGKVAIRDLDGSVSLVAQKDLPAAQDEGARPATQAEYFGAKHGVAGDVAAGLVGAGRTASFGLFDPAVVETARMFGGDQSADEYRNSLRLLKDTSPNATLGGEVVGMVAPALAGGAGFAAEGGAALAESGAARFGQRVLAAAPRAIGEGVGIGLGGQLSEDTLENHKMVAESYLSAGVKGGALGLLLGGGGAGVLGAIGDKVGGGGTLFGRGGARAAEDAEGSLASRVAKLEDAGPYRTPGVANAAEGVGEAGGRKSILERLEDLKNESAYRSTGANRTDWKNLAKTAEGQAEEAQRVGARMQAETFEGKPLVEALASEREVNRRIVGRANEVGKELGAMRAKLDTTLERPSLSTISSRFESEIAPDALEHLGGEVAVNKVRAKIGEMEKLGGEAPTFKQLHTMRRDLEGLAKYSDATPKAETEMFRALRNITEDEFTASGERAAKSIGGTFADDYRLKKALYADLATARDASNRAVGRGSGNNKFSLTDAVMAGGALASGNPAGALAVGANMVRRGYGNQIATHVLGTVTKMDMVQRAANKLDALISDGTKAFVSGSKSATRPVKAVTDAEIRAIREATRSPDVINKRIAEHLGDLPQYAPKTAQEIAITAARAAAWAQHALPKEPAPLAPQFGKPKNLPLSDTQRLKARATIETIEDGSIVVDRLRQGRLTDEHVAALKYVHPETYAKIQQYLGQHAAELNKSMDQQQLFRLSILFGEPLTEAALPENVRALQASFTQGNQAPAPGAAGAPSMSAGPVKGGGSRATSFDKLEAGQ